MTDDMLQQLNSVLAFVHSIPCQCMSVAQLGERDPGCDRCQAANRLYAIRKQIGGSAKDGDWYKDEATGRYVVDWDADPQRQLSIMLKPDGKVAYAVYVEGKRFHGPDAMNTGFMEAIREWGNSETREVTNNLIASLIDISEVGIEGEEREWTDAGHKACCMMAYEVISENEWFFGGRSKPEPVKSPHDWKYRIKDGWPRTWKVPPINQQRNEYFEKRHEWGELAYEMGRFINLIRPRLVGDEISLSYTLQNLMNKWAYQPRKDVK